MNQAKKYEPTEQKVIFHCNSDKVWHNIHIMFYDENDAPINGMSYPGYMMEPYAYAGNEYRTSDGYLTYELTIPLSSGFSSLRRITDDPVNMILRPGYIS